MRPATRVNFAALATVPFVMVLSNSMIIPVLPNIQRALRVGLLQAGLLITVFSIAAGLVIPVGGYLSDRYSRKIVMVPCLFLFGLGGGIAGLAPLVGSHAYTLMMAGRILQGFGAGGTYQVAMALTGDIFQSSERSKALGLLEASNGAGKVVAPILGAAVGLIAWYAPFFVYPIIAWASALLVWSVVREPRSGGTRRRSFGSYLTGLGQIWRGKGLSLGACFLAGGLALFFLFGILSYYSDILESPHRISVMPRGLIIAIPVAVMAVTSYFSGTYLMKRVAALAKLAVLVGLGLSALAFTGMFLAAGRIYLLSAGIALLGFGNGLLLPSLNTMITSASTSRQRGTVTALYGTVRFFGAALGPPVFSRLATAGRAPLYLGPAALAALGFFAALGFLNQRQMLSEGPREQRAADQGGQREQRAADQGGQRERAAAGDERRRPSGRDRGQDRHRDRRPERRPEPAARTVGAVEARFGTARPPAAIGLPDGTGSSRHGAPDRTVAAAEAVEAARGSGQTDQPVAVGVTAPDRLSKGPAGDTGEALGNGQADGLSGGRADVPGEPRDGTAVAAGTADGRNAGRSDRLPATGAAAPRRPAAEPAPLSASVWNGDGPSLTDDVGESDSGGGVCTGDWFC